MLNKYKYHIALMLSVLILISLFVCINKRLVQLEELSEHIEDTLAEHQAICEFESYDEVTVIKLNKDI